MRSSDRWDRWDVAFYIVIGATLLCCLGYYYGTTEMYEKLYGETLECKLTADAFVQKQLSD